MSTLTTEQSRNAVYNFVTEKDKENLFEMGKKIEEELKKDKEYQRLSSELENYVHKFYLKNKPYRNILYRIAVSAMRVSIRMFKANPPREYENTVEFAKKVLGYKEVMNTENKLATFICNTCNNFEIVKVTKKQKFIKYSMQEIRYFVNLIHSDALDREAVREMLKRGKRIKK